MREPTWPAGAKFHVVVVEAYQGRLEFWSDDPLELSASQGLGLPWDELTDLADCSVTILSWDEWYAFEGGRGSPFTWAAKPATRPIGFRRVEVQDPFHSARVRRVPVPARDPGSGGALAEGLSPLSRGLVANRDLLFFVSYCLREELISLARREPFQLILFPLWGGLGYLTQLGRATGVDKLLRVATAVVATDPSALRQQANQEGFWTREAAMRRQMEDLSLALADEVFAFGPRGSSLASRGRLPQSSLPIPAPRRLHPTLMPAIAQAAEESARDGKSQGFFLHEPQQSDAGVLCALDAVSRMHERGTRLARPLSAFGPDAIFAPMRPRGFREYWGSRSFVRELVREKQWSWEEAPPHARGELYAIRLYPSSFEHLPAIWNELARGSAVVLSPAAAEGLASGEPLSSPLLLDCEPSPESLAHKIEQLERMAVEEVDSLRRKLCRGLLGRLRGEEREKDLATTAGVLSRLASSPSRSPSMGAVSLLLLDRRLGLRELAERSPSSSAERRKRAVDPLTVVVTCHQLGRWIGEALESVWASEKQPDEVLIVDDGSEDEETRLRLRELEEGAREDRRPLRVIRQSNRGLAEARNRGLAEAKGTLVSFLDADDLVDRRFYSLAAPLMEENPELGGVAAWAYIFGEGVEPGFWNDSQPELPSLLVQNSVVVPCVSRTEVLRGLGGYDPKLRYNYEDWELSIRILASGRPIVILPAFLVNYRVRGDSLYRTMTDVQNQVMRERIYSVHQDCVTRFAVELSMLIEDRCRQMIHAMEPGPPNLSGKLRGLLRSARRLRPR